MSSLARTPEHQVVTPGGHRSLTRKTSLAAFLFVAAVGINGAHAAPTPRLRAELVQPLKSGRDGASVATDREHGLVYMIGGSPTYSFFEKPTEADLFAWDGLDAWYIPVRRAPPARELGSITYEPHGGRLLLGGGVTFDSFLLFDGWSFDGDTWSPLASVNNPASTAAMMWAPKLGEMLLFGINGAAFSLQDDGWAATLPAPGGPTDTPSGFASVAYHEEADVAVWMTGVISTGGQNMVDNRPWLWASGSWKAPPESSGIEASGLGSFPLGTYDPTAKRVAFCGSHGYSNENFSATCYGWSGTGNWFPLGDPGSSRLPVPFYDSRRQSTMLFASFGLQGVNTPSGEALFELTKKGWKPVGAPILEPPRYRFSGVFEPSRHAGIFFGGKPLLGDVELGTTVEYDGKRIRQLTTAHAPSARSRAAMAHDPVGGGALLFGGVTADKKASSETWIFKGGDWAKLSPPLSPSPRWSPAIATDPLRHRVLLLQGGTPKPDQGGTPAVADEALWAWDGATWATVGSGPSPSPVRVGGNLAYDRSRDRFVLFGGSTSDTLEPLDDTWELDPATDTWAKIEPDHRPEPRGASPFFFDPSLGALVLAGGSAIRPADDAALSTAWLWDGRDWTSLGDTGQLMAKGEAGSYFDPERNKLVVFGGHRPWGLEREMGVVEVSVVGQGCSADLDCSTGHCVDNVCCNRASCSGCESCAVPGGEGACLPVPAGQADDTCPTGACDSEQRCRSRFGQACESHSSCFEGVCTDGVCCREPLCEGACRRCGGEDEPENTRGSCVAVRSSDDLKDCNGPLTCDGVGACKNKTGTPCSAASECASGVCIDGLCRASEPPFCDGDHKLYYADHSTGDCGNYRCTAAGVCNTSCSSHAECVEGARCSADGLCVTSGVDPGATGCAVATLPGPPAPLAPAALAALALLGGVRRRRRALARSLPLVAALLSLGGVARADAPARLTFTETTIFPIFYGGTAIATDTQRGRLVYFGGATIENDLLGGTWELIEGDLTFRTSEGPSARRDAAMAFDPGQGVAVLFGGLSAQGGMSDTWEWDGSVWTRIQDASASHPASSASPRMAYHPARKSLVLLDDQGDTWEREAGFWVKKASGGGPLLPYGAIASCGPGKICGQGEVILLGQQQPSPFSPVSVVMQRWTGSSWIDIENSLSQFERGWSLVYHPDLDQLHLIGGIGIIGQPSFFYWNGNAWFSKPNFPPLWGAQALAGWDPFHREIAILDTIPHANSSSSSRESMLLRLVGIGASGQAERRLSTRQPGAACEAPMALDRKTGEVVLVAPEPTALTEPIGSETWILRDDGGWTLTEGASPPARFGGVSVSLDGGGVLVFGGRVVVSAFVLPSLADTWIRKDGVWTDVTGDTTPVAHEPGCAAPLPGGKVLIFGGADPKTGKPLQAMAMWDGAWTNLTVDPQKSPPARMRCAMAYEPASGRVLLHGGVTGTEVQVDTWAWDGTSWAELVIPPGGRPPPATDVAMFSDEEHGQILLVAGSEIWSWQGLDSPGWSRLDVDPVPAHYSRRIGRDARGRWVVVGGFAAYCEGSTWIGLPSGNPCTPEDACPSGYCVDGVCCEQPSCGTCQGCDVASSKGVCSPRPVLALDDSCDAGLLCSAAQQCADPLGAKCTDGASCASGFCVDGVCCVEASCHGDCQSCAAGPSPGHCGDVFREQIPGRCDGAKGCDALSRCRVLAGGDCSQDEECEGERCSDNVCHKPGDHVCRTDSEALTVGADSKSDLHVTCETVRCRGGFCLLSCKNSGDCADDFRCNAEGRCVQRLPAASTGGCAVAPPGAPDGAAWLALTAVGLLALRAGRLASRRGGRGAREVAS